MEFHDFFPYPTFRKDQEEVIEKLNQALRKGKNILFLAPNGSGKTIDNMTAVVPVALNQNLKVIYLCRTHTQSARVIEELISINSKIKERQSKEKKKQAENEPSMIISAVSIRGRSEMCLHPYIKKIKGAPTDIMNICSDLRKNHNCSFFNRMMENKTKLNQQLKEIAAESTDAQVVIDFCTTNKICPYFFTKLLMKEVRIIVCNYQWMFNPDIRENLLEGAALDLGQSIVLMDECHNLPEMAAEIDSDRLTEYALRQSLKDLDLGRANPEMSKLVQYWLDELEDLRKKIGNEEVAIDQKTILKQLLAKMKLNSIEAYKKALDALQDYGSAIFDEKISSGGSPIDFIGAVVKFLKKFLSALDDKRYFYVAVPNRTKRGDNSVFMEIICMDPREIVKPIYSQTCATISCSGTINSESFITLLGLNQTGKDLEIIEIKSPFPKENMKILVSQSVSTRGDARNDSTYKKMNEKIAEVLFNTPANLGIFCASYIVLKGLLSNGLEGLVRFANKRLFIEDSENTATDNAELIESYKAESKRNGAVLLGVAGGRNSEGEDFPGDFMNGVVIAGFPFQRPTPRIDAKIKYYDSIFNNKGRLFAYTIPAVQRSNQAAGRPIRRLDDVAVIVFLDDRYKFYSGLLSAWIRDNIEIAPEGPNDLGTEIKKFFNSRNKK